MRLILLSLIFVGIASAVQLFGQKIIWADEVVSYSTQFSDNIGNAKQILGKPSSTSKQNIISTSWYPSEPKNYGLEHIEVSFPAEIKPVSVHIYQSQNPGAIKYVIYQSTEGKSDTIYKSKVNYFYQSQAEILSIKVDTSTLSGGLFSIRIESSTNKVNGYNAIDAVGISSSQIEAGYTINNSQLLSGFKGELLSDQVNSPYSELAPIISSDGNKLYFTRKYHPSNTGNAKLEDIWVSERNSQGQFTAPKLIPELNNEHSNYAIALTQDQNTLLLGNVYNEDGSMSRGLSYTMKSGDKWQFPKELEIVDFVNKAQESSFYISYDGLYLFSAIDDGNSYGDIDIYISEKLDDGRWSKPKNLGPDINTASKEGSPFLTADGQTLYFSSAGWPGYGSMDIFRSYKKDSFHSWVEPQNVGPGINSETWDSYFTIPLDGVNGYYVSMKNGYGKEDIFRVPIPEGVMKQEVVQVKGVVTDSEENTPLAATVIYEDISTGEKMGVANTNSQSGEYSVVLLPNRTYGIRAEAKGYFPINKNLEIGIIDSTLIAEGKTIDLKLVKIKKGATITLNNIFFDFGESKLLKTSALELTRVAKFLKSNKDIRIKVIGHTDNVGTDSRNKIVSEERAEAVKSFLLESGISQERIQALGMGKDSPVSDNDTAEGRAKNRRVEFVIE